MIAAAVRFVEYQLGETNMNLWAWIKKNKVRVVAIIAAAFALAGQLGSTLLTDEQRQAIVNFLGILL